MILTGPLEQLEQFRNDRVNCSFIGSTYNLSAVDHMSEHHVETT